MNKREIKDTIIEIKEELASELEKLQRYNEAIDIYEEINMPEKAVRVKKLKADDKVKHLDYDKAIEIYESIGDKEGAAKARKLKAEQGAVKVDQTVIHGDYVDDRDTIVKDSVINKSNIGAGGKSRAEELREAKALLDEGVIDDNEFKQMKKEILNG